MNLDTRGGSIHCHTNKSGCCKSSSGREGEWIYPNGSIVKTKGSNGDFYRTRGEGVVSLIWTENAVLPEGVFCCEIPSDQNVCIGVYPKDEGNNCSIALYINSAHTSSVYYH